MRDLRRALLTSAPIWNSVLNDPSLDDDTPHAATLIQAQRIVPHHAPAGFARSIFRRILLVAWLPLLFAAAVQMYDDTQRQLQQNLLQLNLRAESKQQLIEQYFTDHAAQLRALAAQQSTRAYLSQVSAFYQQSKLSLETFTQSDNWKVLHDHYAADLLSVMQAQAYLDLQLIDTQGNVLYSAKRAPALGTNLLQGAFIKHPTTQVFRNALRTGSVQYIDNHGDTDNMGGGYLAIRVLNAQQTNVGVLIAQLHTQTINQVLHGGLSVLEHERSYIIAQDLRPRFSAQARHTPTSTNDIQEHNTRLTQHWLQQLRAHPKPGSNGVSLDAKTIAYRNRQHNWELGALRPMYIGGTPLALVIERDASALYDPWTILQNRSVLLYAAAALVILILASITSRHLATPLRQLSDWAANMADGDLQCESLSVPHNEFHTLNQSLIRLSGRLQNLTRGLHAAARGDFHYSSDIPASGDTLALAVHELMQQWQQITTQIQRMARGEWTPAPLETLVEHPIGEHLTQIAQGLQDAADHIQYSNWLQEAQQAFNAAVQVTPDDTTAEALIALAKHCETTQVAVYVSRDARTLHCLARYGEDNAKNSDTLEFGEGLVGQAAQQNIAMIIDPPQSDDDEAPQEGDTRIALPLNINNEHLVGILELTFEHPPLAHQLEFAQAQCPILALLLHALNIETALSELQQDTQQQSLARHQLQAQFESNRQQMQMQTDLLHYSQQQLDAKEQQLNDMLAREQRHAREVTQMQEQVEQGKTQLLAAQSQIKETQRDLQRAIRNNNELLNNLSHALRTPLYNLFVQAQHLKNHGASNMSEREKESAALLHFNAHALLNFVDNALELESNIDQSNTSTSVTLDEVLRDLQQSCSPLAHSRDIQLRFERAAQLPVALHYDGTPLKQLLRNLLNSAIQNSTRGEVRLDIERATHPEDGQAALLFRIRQSDPQNRNNELETNEENRQNQALAAQLGGLLECALDTQGAQRSDLYLVLNTPHQDNTAVPTLTDKIKWQNEIHSADITTQAALVNAQAEQLTRNTDTQPNTNREPLSSPKSSGADYNTPLSGTADVQSEAASRSATVQHHTPPPTTATQIATPVSETHHDADAVNDSTKATSNAEDEADRHTTSNTPIDEHPTANQAKSATATILIAEADKHSAESLTKLLVNKGYQYQASHGVQATLEVVRDVRPAAIILDLDDNDDQALVILQQLQNDPQWSSIPVFAISARNDNLRCLELGASAFLAKPLTQQDLDHLIPDATNKQPKHAENVLIIDPDPVRLYQFCRVLHAPQVKLDTCDNGGDAVDKIVSVDYDLIVLQLALPDISGLDLLTLCAYTRQKPLPPVIALSVQTLTEPERQALRSYTHSIICGEGNHTGRLLEQAKTLLHNLPFASPTANIQTKPKSAQPKRA